MTFEEFKGLFDEDFLNYLVKKVPAEITASVDRYGVPEVKYQGRMLEIIPLLIHSGLYLCEQAELSIDDYCTALKKSAAFYNKTDEKINKEAENIIKGVFD